MKYRFIGALFLSALIFSSCKDDEILNNQVGDDTVNGWIYSTMKKEYLWNDEIRDFTKYNTEADPETFFSSLISSNEKKQSSSGYQYCYSYIEEDDTKLITHNGLSYGIHFINYRISNYSTRLISRILYVIPGSPADKAGIKRGDFIMSINGTNISSSNYYSLISGGATNFQIYRGILVPDEAADIIGTSELWETYNVTSAVKIEVNPILSESVFEYNNIKVGYLNYLQFSMGTDGIANNIYTEELKNTFLNFKNAGVDEFILDLRYNGGGYLEVARTLASMIVPTKHLNNVFCTLKFNDSNSSKNSTIKFNYSLKDYNINVSRVYILTTYATASASEAVLNGLAASDYMEVIQIGETTEGKNLGSIEYKSDKYPWVLHPIVSSIANADGYGEYYDGITPLNSDYIYDETESNTYLGQFGEIDDPMVELALLDMTGTKTSRLNNDNSTISLEKASSYIKIHNYNSVIIE